jgi:hypothetical protein
MIACIMAGFFLGFMLSSFGEMIRQGMLLQPKKAYPCRGKI